MQNGKLDLFMSALVPVDQRPATPPGEERTWAAAWATHEKLHAETLCLVWLGVSLHKRNRLAGGGDDNLLRRIAACRRLVSIRARRFFDQRELLKLAGMMPRQG